MKKKETVVENDKEKNEKKILNNNSLNKDKKPKETKIKKKWIDKEIKDNSDSINKSNLTNKDSINNQKKSISPTIRKKKQRMLEGKKSTLAVKNRQTKWAPVWVVLKKYGTGKKIHPSSITNYKRSWRRTKLHIKPRKIRKWHMG